MSNTLNIGLIGSGFMGQAHADAYRRAGNLYKDLACTPVLYAIADQNDELAERSRRRLGFEKAYGDWRRRLSDGIASLHDWLRRQELSDAQVDLKIAQINLGYTNVLWYRGGIEAWKQAGMPVQSAQ